MEVQHFEVAIRILGGLLSAQQLDGDPKYFDAAKRAMVALYNRRSRIGLVGSMIDVETGVWLGKDSSVGCGIDSYYEYVLKGAILLDDPEL
jgi:mannosidase alpha-like ER degradation enhancer 2